MRRFNFTALSADTDFPLSQYQEGAKRMCRYPLGFEENDALRSAFIRDLTLHLLERSEPLALDQSHCTKKIPKTLIRYWHDPNDLPSDVSDCISSWDSLVEEGFEVRMFCDESAAAFLTERFSDRERKAFERCRHPAMRSDYLRMCVMLAEGGFYVDTDDVLISDNWRNLFDDDKMKIQPLCYDSETAGMVSATDIWRSDLQTDGRIFYVNNNPIAAPADHPIIRRALSRATDLLLGEELYPEIQSTTGPGNLTAALAAHAHNLITAKAPLDFEILSSWNDIAETRWHLSYRNDERNWRNMDTVRSTNESI